MKCPSCKGKGFTYCAHRKKTCTTCPNKLGCRPHIDYNCYACSGTGIYSARMQLIDKVINWSKKADPKKTKRWLEFARAYLTDMGWNEIAIKDWLDQGDGGFNNESLRRPISSDVFYPEVMYCSDRMTLDRLFRCHVMFRNIKE